MKIKPGQYEVTHYTDQDRTRLGVDPLLRKLEYVLLALGVIFVGVSAYGVWFIWTMK